MTFLTNVVWRSLDEDWPTGPSDECLMFYNAHLDIYAFDSLDGVEYLFKQHQQELSELDDFEGYEDDLKDYLTHRYRYTHWAPRPAPPD